MDFIDYLITSITTQGSLTNTVLVTILSLIAGKIALNAFDRVMSKSKVLDKTLANFIRSSAKFAITFFVILFIANAFGFNTSSIVALASVLSAAFALAAQNVLSNLFGGVTMLATRPFVIGNYISAAGVDGTVKEIGMFYTKLITPDNKLITIPNSAISSQTIVNFSAEEKRRVDLKISASYDCSTESVKKAVMDAVKMTENVLEDDVFVKISEYGSSAITYTIRVWAKGGDYWQVYFDLTENLRTGFEKENVQMTYDHLIIHNGK